ncbi:MAG: PAS domain S-box protein [Thermodesulfobacteriota bacterium]
MSSAKILVVEDEWLVAQGISENLQDLGYEVAGLAPSGAEALRLAAESRPDLVVMDILLQGEMDGIDTAEHLRQRFNLPVVFLTASADSHTLERAKAAEPYGYILKPFEVRELHSAVEIALYKSRAEKRLQHVAGILRAIRNVNQLIVQEKDRGRLIQRACQLLTAGRDYFTAWIALVEKKGKITAFAVDGEERDTARLRQLLQKGEMPQCGRRALKEKDLLVIEDLSPQAGCFLWENYQDRGVLVAPLVHQRHIYGALGVLLPVTLARDEEELSLFKEVAADLSLALFNLDLEEREQHAQAALRASEEKFRLLVENANQIILVVQGDRIRFANPAAVTNSGYSLEELTSRPFLEFVHPDDREWVMKVITDRIQGREVPNAAYCRYFQKNGALRWAEIKTSDITWEGEPATLNCISDITEKKEMVEALRESEERYRTVADFTYDMEYWLGPDQELIYMSPSCERLTGYSREEFFQATDLLEKIAHPEDRDLWDRHIKEARVCRHHLDADFRLIRRDGREVWVSHACQPVYGLEGQYLGRRVSNRDITARKQAEEALRQTNETLRATLDAAPVAIFDLDTEGRVEDIWNPAAEQMLGWSRDEVLGKFLPSVPEESREEFAAFRAWLRSGKPMLGKDVVRRRKDGSPIEYSIYAAPKYDDAGQVTGNIAVLVDITARKRAEEAVAAERQRFYSLLEAMPAYLGLLTPDYQVAFANRYFRDRFGEPGGRRCYDYMFGRSSPCENCQAVKVLETKKPEEYEWLGPDGRTYQICDQLVHDTDGSPLILEMGIDITERKRAEEELRQSEERFRLLVENAPDAIVIQKEKRFAYLNKEALRLFGASTEEQLLGRPVLERFPLDLHDLIQERIRLVNIERKAIPPRELQVLQMDGTPMEVEASTVPFRYQEKNGALVFFRDISDRKRAEEAVQAGVRLNRLLLDSLPCVAMLIRPYTREIVAANQAALQVGAVPGAFCYATWGQRQDPCPFCLAPQAWETGQSQYLEVEALDKVWDAHWVPIKEDLYLHYAFDITARKETERTQKMLEAQLMQAQKMEALGTLAGGIAHDFNNILGAMLGFAELAHIGLPEDSEAGGYLENLLKAGDRARSLVKQILSFSRQEKATRQPLSLTPIIKEALKFLRASLPTTIEIKTHLQAGKAMVVADPTQIQQILLNLVTNAAHAMEEKGGILAIGLRVVHLTPEETSLYEGIAPGPYLELRVSDTGPGLDPEIRKRIFEPFFTTKEPWKGTGMGLAVVYGIVKSMAGTIRVISQPGQGAAFLVLLPLVEVEPAQAELEIITPLSKGAGRLLFVDDDADFFQAGQRMLTELGYEVAAFDNSLEALQEFQAQPRQFDLLICDQTMPGLTGLELAAACSRVRPDLPIILCTGFSEIITPEKVRAAGVREVVTKPFDLRQIGESIKKVLKKNQTIVE